MKLVLGMELGLSPGDFVLDGDPDPLPKKGAEPPPQFSIHVYCSQTAAWIKKSLGTEVGLGPYDIVLDWDPARQLPLPKKGAEPPPHFSAHFWATVCKAVRPMLSVSCLSVCLSVCLSSVLSVCNVRALWPNCWTDQDETWHLGRPRPWLHCVRWNPAPLPQKGTAPQFAADIRCG